MAVSCKAIIFDLDGVLVDSEAAIEDRWRCWAESRDIPFEEVEAVYHGRPMEEVIREVAPHLDARAETERMDDVMTAAPEKLRPFEKTQPLLEKLPADRWTIATSGRYRTATNRLTHVGLPIPDTIVTTDDVENGKPAPDSYLLAAERLDVAPEDCVVLEDAPAGVEGARRADTFVIGVATSIDSDALSDADVVVRSVADLDVAVTVDAPLQVDWDTEA